MPANTIETLLMPPSPKQRDIKTIEDAGMYIHDLQGWISAVQFYQDDLYNVLHNGYLVRNWQIENLTADTIISGTITADQIYITDNKFEINGVLQQIIVKDDQGTPVTRLEIGKFGSGSDYGIKVRNASGTVVFQATTSTFMDGAIINNATITGAKLINATVAGTKLEDLAITTGKLANSSVTNSKISDLSASKITVSGTLTCTSSTTAIAVTSSGVVNFSGGGDIRMRATATDTNFITYQNSAGSDRGYITYQPSTNTMYFAGNNANATFYASAGNCALQASGSVTVTKLGQAVITVGDNIIIDATVGGTIATRGDLRPTVNNTDDCGTSGLKWANMWTVVDHVGDIEFENGWRITEPDKVYKGAPPHSGLLIMSDRWECMGGFDREGNFWVRGFVKPLHGFLPPDVARRESKEDEVGYGTKRTFDS